jgi:hypothetical protein
MNLKELSRPLEISDVDFRVQSINNGGYATILAYKDARVDMNRLDEVVGPLGWQRDYKLIDGKLFCGVGVYNSDTSEWVWKWDVGTESNTEKEKGQASDAFKRACFNLGIGRELYSYPIISIKLNANEWEKKKGYDGKERPTATFDLKIKDWRWYSEFTDGQITFLAAKDQNGTLRFKWGTMKPKDKDIEPSYAPASGGEPVSEIESPAVVKEEPNIAGLLKKEESVDVDIQFQPVVDTEREEAVADYEAMFGKKPHGRMSTETILNAINEESAKRMSEQLKEDEEPNVPEAEMEQEDQEEAEAKKTILNHLYEIEKHTNPSEFVAWAKGLVAEYIEIDAADVIDTFKDYCNNHYSKISK